MTAEAFVWNMLQALGPAIGIYVAIRVDLARALVRLDHLERDFYTPRKP